MEKEKSRARFDAVAAVLSLPPGDAVMLVDTQRRWSNAPQIAAEMGARTRQMLGAQFNRRRALDRYI
jgi:hypothetical protein